MRILVMILNRFSVRSNLLGALVLAVSLPLSAQYSARRDGDVVRLEDAKNQTVVSVLPSVGDVVFEMTVKGQNILRFPYASVEAFKARPGLAGIPFLGPWANRLDEDGFYANGKHYTFNMSLGNIRGAIPLHWFFNAEPILGGGGGKGGQQGCLGNLSPGFLPAPGLDGAVPFRSHGGVDAKAGKWRT